MSRYDGNVCFHSNGVSSVFIFSSFVNLCYLLLLLEFGILICRKKMDKKGKVKGCMCEGEEKRAWVFGSIELKQELR